MQPADYKLCLLYVLDDAGTAIIESRAGLGRTQLRVAHTIAPAPIDPERVIHAGSSIPRGR